MLAIATVFSFPAVARAVTLSDALAAAQRDNFQEAAQLYHSIRINSDDACVREVATVGEQASLNAQITLEQALQTDRPHAGQASFTTFTAAWNNNANGQINPHCGQLMPFYQPTSTED